MVTAYFFLQRMIIEVSAGLERWGKVVLMELTAFHLIATDGAGIIIMSASLD